VDVRAFFAANQKEDIWVELELCAVTVHPDTSCDLHHGFLIRMLGHGLDGWYESSPIQDHYPDMWEEGFSVTMDNPSFFWRLYGIWHEGEQVHQYDGGIDDAIEARIMIPKRFVPSLDNKHTWSPAAWGAYDGRHLQSHISEGLRHAEIYSATRTQCLYENTLYAFDAGMGKWHPSAQDAWKHAQGYSFDSSGQLWGVTSQGLQKISFSSSGALEGQEFIERPATLAGCTNEGVFWFFDGQELTLRFPSGQEKQVPYAEGPNAPRYISVYEELLVIYDRGQLWIYLEGTWKKHDVGDVNIRWIGFSEGGTLWVVGFETLLAFSYDKLLSGSCAGQRYGKEHGFLGYYNFALLAPQDTLLLKTSERLLAVTPDDSRIRPFRALYPFAPEGIVASCQQVTEQGERIWWCLTKESHLLRLQESFVPQYMAWSHPLPDEEAGPDRSALVREMTVSPQGDVCCYGTNALFVLPHSLIQETLEEVPFNEPLFSWLTRESFAFPKAAEKLPAVDLSDKRFYCLGQLDTMTKKRFKEILVSYGAKLSSTISKNIDYFIFGKLPLKYHYDMGTRVRLNKKINKARELHLNELSESGLLELLANAKEVD